MSNKQRLNDPDWAHFGLMFPRKFLQRLDEAKGPYYSRTKFIMKILEEHLNENERKGKLQGVENVVGTTTHQAAAPTPPPVKEVVTEAYG